MSKNETKEKTVIIKIKGDTYPKFNVTNIVKNGDQTSFDYKTKDGRTFTWEGANDQIASIETEK